jgi:DNA-binding NarL/FixJ family response regulator
MIRMVLADDHPLIRGAMKLKFEGQGIEVIAEAGDGLEAIDLVESLAPDVVVLDRDMPRVGGLEAARRLLDRRPDERIILVTADDQPDTIIQAGRLGIRGYALKDDPTERILKLVHTVAEGGYGPRMRAALEQARTLGDA